MSDADRIKALEGEVAKWKQMLRSAFPEKTGAMFICGRSGGGGIPDRIHVCPAYGADVTYTYQRLEKERQQDG